ncbi:Smr/MutS family protein [Coralliovum pocilloporae]|uniref:Smr/MutS family protein n=1 Tax=Coralliovum pocilloporae TaxID=3066369 RepID=UPI0033073E2E
MKKSRRRFGHLSDDDLKVWNAVAKTVTPLDGRYGPVKENSESETTEIPGEIKKLAGLSGLSKTTEQIKKTGTNPSIPHIKPLAPLEQRLRRKLVKGRVSIDARIDLHGMTQAEAHMALRGFLFRCHQNDHRLALVITGKGTRKGEGGDTGILRRVVPQWLRQPDLRPFVVSIEEAHLSHGGAGALYIRIRRRREGRT